MLTRIRQLPSRRLPAVRLRVVLAAIALAVAGYFLYQRWFAADTSGDVSAMGTLEATEVSISSEVTARILEIDVDEGQAVRTGDLLVRLDDAIPQLQYRQADVTTRQTLTLQLAKYELHAPRDGVVLRRSAEPGEIAVAGAPLLVIGDLANLDLTLYVLQRDVGRVRVGQPVSLEAEALPGVAFAGVVRSVADQAEFTPRNTQTSKDRLNLVFAVKVRVPNAEHRLKPGMSVAARFLD